MNHDNNILTLRERKEMYFNEDIEWFLIVVFLLFLMNLLV